MKQLKFLKTVCLESKPIWYKDCCYEVVEEGVNDSGKGLYKTFCEDLVERGIDVSVEGKLYIVINIEDKKEEPKVEITEEKKEIKGKPKSNVQKTKYNNKKKKSSK